MKKSDLNKLLVKVYILFDSIRGENLSIEQSATIVEHLDIIKESVIKSAATVARSKKPRKGK